MPWPDGTKKYDLHKHYGGSISSRMVSILLGGAMSEEEVASRMVCAAPVSSFAEFLAKFDILNEVHWTEKAIALSIDQVVADQASDGVDYSELSFSLDKYMHNHVRWTRPELVLFVHDVVTDACRRHGTEVALLLSLKMESKRSEQRTNADLIGDDRVVGLLAGLDIVGDEGHFDADFYAPIFRDWRRAGKVVLAHAGETCGPENLHAAITHLGAHRVRHGISADRDIMLMANDYGVCFDVALHSNHLVGTRPLENHHLPALLAAGCAVTLGTDDPVVFRCRLEDEYNLGLRYGLFGADADAAAATVATMRSNSVKFSARGS